MLLPVNLLGFIAFPLAVIVLASIVYVWAINRVSLGIATLIYVATCIWVLQAWASCLPETAVKVGR